MLHSHLRPGLVSVTFRALALSAIIELAARAGLQGIEWGDDVHVPHGNVATAREVCRRTHEAGLQVAAYGSYYRVGHGEQDLPFERVLETACELNAPLVRVWAGNQAASDDGYFARVADDARRVAMLASAAGVCVACEWHGGTLTETPASAERLMRAAAHPNLRLLWQPFDWPEKSEAEIVATNLWRRCAASDVCETCQYTQQLIR